MTRGISHPRLVVITGAGSGIGRATALEFGRIGATVIATDIDEIAAAETAYMVKKPGGQAFSYRLDVTDVDGWVQLAAELRTAHGTPDVLVNNAGVIMIGAFLDSSSADWHRQIEVNLMGVVHGTAVIGKMMADYGQGGHIVNVASAAAYVPFAMVTAYCTVKASVRMLSEVARIELAEHGIGVSVICPGAIDTGLARNAEMPGYEPGLAAGAKSESERLLRRFGGDPRHVATAIVRSVRHNWAIVPVRPESWVGYIAQRVSPGAVRVATGLLFNQRFVNRFATHAHTQAPTAASPQKEYQ